MRIVIQLSLFLFYFIFCSGGWGEWWLGGELDYMQTPICSSAAEPLAHACYKTRLIDADGSFNVAASENFVKEVELDKCGLWYAVVSIIGPQSGGMLSCLHNLFVSGMFGFYYFGKDNCIFFKKRKK